ncbi:MAG TPA: right-handed parallel beta-helix repeat-containing protein [Allosphingosinicella sp.]|nr:right-handed parallel beta-helix repeat-containing protein [Allosphingosinicella sp.]
MTRTIALVLAAALSAGSLGAQPASARFTIVETGRAYARLADAVEAIGDGRGTIRIAPGRYRDCAVQEAGRIAFVAETPGTAIFDGGICEDKATLVLRGRSARVEGLVFTHNRVADGNGAGIRIEQGDLSVAYVRFVDSQCGILSAADPDGTISIDHSTFSGLGRHPDGNGAHSLYIGHYGALRVTNSRFERGTGGHYLKSRSPRIEVLNNSFDDSQGRDTNYMIDLPEGAVGRIAGNIFVQGPAKENYGTLIAVHAEEGDHPSAGLIIEDNVASVAPGFRWSTAFVGDWSGEDLVIRNNRLGERIAPFRRH